MIVKIAEGETKAIPATDTLEYPDINSCISVTSVLANGTRYGGHAVMFPAGTQQNLQQICDFINANKGTTLYIIGDTETWNQNWNELPETQNLIINGKKVSNVAGIATTLGYTGSAQVIYDTYNWGTDTYNLYFSSDSGRSLYGQKGADGPHKTIPGHTSW